MLHLPHHFSEVLSWLAKSLQRHEQISISRTADKRSHGTMTGIQCCRLVGSADLFEAAIGEGLPGGLAAGRRPAFGLNSINYFGKVLPSASVCLSLCHADLFIPLLMAHVLRILCCMMRQPCPHKAHNLVQCSVHCPGTYCS